MLILYSDIKKYLPELDATPEEVANIFTMIGYMLDGRVEEVSNNGNKDYLMDLEVRQNRADCFGVFGLIRDLSAYYNIDVKIPSEDINIDTNFELPIQVKAKNSVKRVLAVKLSSVKIGESPVWLKEYLNLYGINSINNLVDLTNYVMILTAHPSHAFDVSVSGESLVWEINPEYKKMTSLDGTEIDLVKESLIISGKGEPQALAGLVGGKKSAINNNSTEVIIEMAVYDGGLVRRNSRQMNIFTEASQRLQKYMDPESLPHAFKLLISYILKECGGKVSSKIFEEYNQKTEFNMINVDLNKVSQMAGIKIAYEESKDYLLKLGFKIENENENVIDVIKPINRLDIEEEADVIEEIIRLKGTYNLPKNRLTVGLTKDITSSHLKLIDKVRSTLVENGYDEVRSWVLVKDGANSAVNYSGYSEVKVQNSINDEVPNLRQTISVSLLEQLKEQKKKDIPDIKIFEIGKIFNKTDSEYLENYSLGILLNNTNINLLKTAIEKILLSNKISKVFYSKTEKAPDIAHDESCYDILIGNKKLKIGVIYLTNKFKTDECVVCEINIDELDIYMCELGESKSSTIELTKKVVNLDANINSTKGLISEIVEEKLASVENNIWKWEVIDEFEGKFTVRVYYYGLSDTEAKVLHEQTFKV